MKTIITIIIIGLGIFLIGKINPMEDNSNGGFDSFGRYIAALIVVVSQFFLIFGIIWKDKKN